MIDSPLHGINGHTYYAVGDPILPVSGMVKVLEKALEDNRLVPRDDGILKLSYSSEHPNRSWAFYYPDFKPRDVVLSQNRVIKVKDLDEERTELFFPTYLSRQAFINLQDLLNAAKVMNIVHSYSSYGRTEIENYFRFEVGPA